jgi:solute carrier family 35 protein F5
MWSGLGLITLVVFIWVAAGELIQQIEVAEHVGPFFLTYFSAALFALWLPVVLCRGLAGCGRGRAQRYELLPQGEAGGGGEADDGGATAEGAAGDGAAVGLPLARGGFRAMLRLGLLFGPLWFAANWSYNTSLELTSVASVTILSATSSSWCLLGAFVVGTEQLLPLHPNVATKIGAVLLNLIGVAVVALSDDDGGESDSGAIEEGVVNHGAQDAAASSPVSGAGAGAGERSLVGDLVAVGSAVCYAAYTTLLERKLDDDADMLALFAFLGEGRNDCLPARPSMPLLAVSVCCRILAGMCAVGTMAPAGLLAVAAGVEPPPSLPPWPTLRLLVLNGLAGTFLSQILWARSVLLTSPLIATCGLSLTIPVAMLADVFLRDRHFGAVYLAGSGCVTVGFAMVASADAVCGRIGGPPSS